MAKPLNKLPDGVDWWRKQIDYDWERWADGGIWELDLEEYSKSALIRSGRYYGEDRGLKMRVRTFGDVIYIQFYKEDNDG